MNQDKYIFLQLTEFMDNNKFYRIVKKYDGDKGNRGLPWMVFLGCIYPIIPVDIPMWYR